MVGPKFGKQSGAAPLTTPSANSVTSDKIFDGTIATADIGATSVTAAKLGSDVAGAGLGGGNGAAIEIDLHDITAEVIDVAADKIAFMDATDNSTKLEAVADMIGLVAGTASATALTAASGVLKVAPADAGITVGADSFVYATAAGVTKKDLVSDVASAMSDGTTITSSAGVFSVKTSSLGIAQMANDDKASIFYVTGTHDFGQNAAKDTDLGALGAKGTLIGGYMVLTEALNGTDATHTVTISSAAAGATPIATANTITKANTADGQSNELGATRAFRPLAAGVDMASTAHVYAYTAVDGTRTTGIVEIVLIFQKSA